jgi:hypothetical protein
LGKEVVGTIDKMEIGPEGQFLLLDVRLGEAFLVDSTGHLIKRINVEDSLPGFRWHPLTACFSPAGEVLVWSGGTEILLFDRLGGFKRKIETGVLREYRDLAVDPQGHIFAYAVQRNEFAVVKMDPGGRELARGGTFPKEYRNYMYRMEEGGSIVIGGDGLLYQSNICGPEVYKHSADLRLLRTFVRTPPFFTRLPKDDDGIFADPRRFVELRTVLRKVTQTTQVYALDDSLLLVQYLVMAEGRLALDIWSTGGKNYPNDAIRYETPIIAAKGDLIYRAFQPGPDSQGNLPNPFLVEYRLRFQSCK